MKLTKSQLKQIIKEELSNITEGGYAGHYEGTSDQMAIEQVKEVTTLFADLYNGLPDDESKELFEQYLNANVQLYTERWQEERSSESSSWLDAPPTMPPPQKPFSITDRGETPTLQEQIKKILSEA